MKLFIQKHAIKLLVFFSILIVVLLILLFKFLFFNKDNFESEVSVLVEKVGTHMFLPVGEIPSVATVSEPEKLQGQDFFSQAKKGDKVLIYSNAKKAILYDPNADKIVTIAPIFLDPKLENNSGNPVPSEF